MLTIRTRGYLPHWELPGSTYAVTFRLADSLPQSILNAYLQERQHILDTAAQMQRDFTLQEQSRLEQLFSDKIEHYLDQGVGDCHLKHPEVADLVFNAIEFFHPDRYELFTWCIMPNHAHALFCPKSPHTLDTILQSWKSFTSRRANDILQRTGIFWMPEYYDHLVRNQQDFIRQHRYILNNPVKANLKNWKWVKTFVQETPES